MRHVGTQPSCKPGDARLRRVVLALFAEAYRRQHAHATRKANLDLHRLQKAPVRASDDCDALPLHDRALARLEGWSY